MRAHVKARVVGAFNLAIFIAIALPVLAEWSVVRPAFQNAHGPYLVSSWIVLAAGVVLMAHAWRQMARVQGAPMPLCQGLELYTHTHLAGRLPGQVWPLVVKLWKPVVAAFCASHLFGMLILITPQGLGAREGALALLLSQSLPVPMAGLIALLARLWATAADPP